MYTCPKCGADIDKRTDRVHRRFYERLLSLVIKVRRYQCGACGWSGLLRSIRVQQTEAMSVVSAKKEPTTDA